MTAIPSQRISVDQFLEMEFPEDNMLYELLEGIIVKRSSPTPAHQRVVRKIGTLLEKWIPQMVPGEYFSAPLDVYLGEFTCVQPDLLFISKNQKHLVDEERGISGAPDLVVEVLSVGTAKRDRLEKKHLYEQFGVREYWIVDPVLKTLELFCLKNDRYELHGFFEEGDEVESTVLKGVKFGLAEIF